MQGRKEGRTKLRRRKRGMKKEMIEAMIIFLNR